MEGGGLISGMCCAIKTLKPDCDIVGVEPGFAASHVATLDADKPSHFHVVPVLGKKKVVLSRLMHLLCVYVVICSVCS